jgi:hypothetical protein
MGNELTAKPNPLHDVLYDPHYWDRPEKTTSRDAEADTLHRAVGMALSTWEMTELYLAGLFGVFIESKSSAGARAYGMVTSANGRADALGDAGKVFFQRHRFPAETSTTFRKIVAAYRKAAMLRNDIAHGMVTWTRIKDGKLSGYVLMPPPYNSRRMLAALYNTFSGEPPGVPTSALEDYQKWIERSVYCYSSEDVTLIGLRLASLLGTIGPLCLEIPKRFWGYEEGP